MKNEDLDKLKLFFRQEVTDLETYRELRRYVTQQELQPTLEACFKSHLRRAGLLQEAIHRQGGRAIMPAGLWRKLHALLGAGGRDDGDLAVARLEAAEADRTQGYRRDIPELSPPVAAFIRSQILPEQEQTERTMQSLKKRLEQAA